MDLGNIHWHELLFGWFLTVVVAYALRTIPPITNPWGKWLVGILQFALANWEQARAQVRPTDQVK